MHRYDLEEIPGNLAFDGARVEVFGPSGIWEPATPVVDYTHVMAINDQGLPQNSMCWSGRQNGWRQESIDLSPWAPGPVRVRFRMSTDLFVGHGGWWIDQVRIHFPDQAVTGVGSGQPNRLESVRTAVAKAGNRSHGSVLASDAFFPFADGLQAAIAAGITAAVQPGGSVRDDEVIAAANRAGIAMLFTGTRHFLH